MPRAKRAAQSGGRVKRVKKGGAVRKKAVKKGGWFNLSSGSKEKDKYWTDLCGPCYEAQGIDFMTGGPSKKKGSGVKKKTASKWPGRLAKLAGLAALGGVGAYAHQKYRKHYPYTGPQPMDIGEGVRRRRGGSITKKKGAGARGRKGGSLMNHLLSLAATAAPAYGAYRYGRYRERKASEKKKGAGARKTGRGFGSKLKNFAKKAILPLAALAGTALLGHHLGKKSGLDQSSNAYLRGMHFGMMNKG